MLARLNFAAFLNVLARRTIGFEPLKTRFSNGAIAPDEVAICGSTTAASPPPSSSFIARSKLNFILSSLNSVLSTLPYRARTNSSGVELADILLFSLLISALVSANEVRVRPITSGLMPICLPVLRFNLISVASVLNFCNSASISESAEFKIASTFDLIDWNLSRFKSLASLLTVPSRLSPFILATNFLAVELTASSLAPSRVAIRIFAWPKIPPRSSIGAS